MKYLLSWVALAVATTVGLGALNWPSYRRLVADGASTKALVIELLPREHQFVRYEFDAAGRRIQGRSGVWPPNPPFGALVVGESLLVHYDPSDPANTVLGNPRIALDHETRSIALGALVLPTFAIGVWAWRNRHGRRRGDSI